MSDYTFFEIDQYESMSLLTLKESAATWALQDGELRIELEAFVLARRPRCVIVSFARLERCPSSLIGGLIGLNRKLKERGCRLQLCEMNSPLRELFHRLSLNRLFEMHGSLSDAAAACEQWLVEGEQPVR